MAATVLICDNEEVLRSLVRATLNHGDYELAEACNGDEALALARELRPDVILLDMMMPGRTGLEVLTELRAEPGFEDTRVVVLTARAQESDRASAVGAGADSFLTKPFSP